MRSYIKGLATGCLVLASAGVTAIAEPLPRERFLPKPLELRKARPDSWKYEQYCHDPGLLDPAPQGDWNVFEIGLSYRWEAKTRRLSFYTRYSCPGRDRKSPH